MGTRNLTMIYNEGKYVLAKYCQWDGYPTGQGAEICDFLERKGNIERLKEKIGNLRYISEEEYYQAWDKAGQPRDKNTVSPSVRNKFNEMFPELIRDTGGKILSLIANSEGEFKTYDDLEFAADSLFCEWAYVIDFDKNVFEIYRGFNHAPLNEEDRFYFLSGKAKENDYRTDYTPIKMVKSYPLNFESIPSYEELKAIEQRQYDKEEEEPG